MLTTPTYRTTVWDDGNVVVEIELVDEYPFIHCTIGKWNKETKLLCTYLLDKLINHYGVVFCLSTNSKTSKFAKLLQFEKAIAFDKYTIFVKD